MLRFLTSYLEPRSAIVLVTGGSGMLTGKLNFSLEVKAGDVFLCKPQSEALIVSFHSELELFHVHCKEAFVTPL